MLFSSTTFLFVFLPLVFILYFLFPRKFNNIILLAASILFYTWGEPEYILILILIVITAWIGGLSIDKTRNYPIIKKAVLFFTVSIILSALIYFKYLNFVLESISSIFRIYIPTEKIIMPVGISFYTFQSLSYIFDVYKGTVKKEQNFSNLLLYISLFPQLVAGPIIKYSDIKDQINSRSLEFENIATGIKRFIIGLAKKIIIANTLGEIVIKIFEQTPDTFSPYIAWLGAVCYSLQIFFDFSGYSDMAIGLGLIFGFKYAENFNYPYISKSITEFWRRWHISLSNWFKEYVYFPMGGNKSGTIKTVRNLAVVFLLTGIWHGAELNFIIWGIYNGFFIILEKILNIGKKDEFNTPKPLLIHILRHLYTIIICMIGLVIFRSDNIEYAIVYIKNMFFTVKIHDKLYLFPYYIERYELIIIVIAIVCSTPLFSNMLKKSKSNCLINIVVNIWIIILFCFSIILIASNTYNPFIYFKF